MIRRLPSLGMHGVGGIPLMSLGGKGQSSAGPFVGAYDAIANLVHVYEPARCTLSAYSGGNLLRLRRASDDAESNFSHVSASDPELDLAAIAAWAGGASYIVSVYDQVNGDTITQATKANQPLFVASIKNSHAGGRFNGTSHYLAGPFTIGGALSQPVSVYAVAALDAVAVNDDVTRKLIDSDDATNRLILGKYKERVPDGWYAYCGVALQDGAANSAWNVWSFLANNLSSQIWLNAVSIVSGQAGAHGADGLTVGSAYNGTDFWDGDWTSIVICDPSHSDAQRIAMQTTMNSYWAVY